METIRLNTDRLLMRPLQLSDLNNVHALHSHAEVDQYNTLGIPESIDATKEMIDSWVQKMEVADIRSYTWVVEQIIDGEFIGLIAINLSSKKKRSGEVWYKLLPIHWKKGFATESLRGVLDFAFGDLNLHRVEAGSAVENVGSISVLEKVGMTREGRKRLVLPLKSGWSDNYEYAILEIDYIKG